MRIDQPWTALVFIGFAACSQPKQSTDDDVGHNLSRDALAQTACMSDSTAWTEGRVIRASIANLFVDSAVRTVDNFVCVANEVSAQGPRWYRSDTTVKSPKRIVAATRVVDGLFPSPDGKYLAVALLSEALGVVDVVDLPALVLRGEYRVLQTLSGFPASVSIEGWRGAELEVSSDALLSSPLQGVDRIQLPSKEFFRLNIESGRVTPRARRPTIER